MTDQPTSFNSVLDQLPEQRIAAGQSIFQQGDSCNQYFILRDGCARVFTRSVNGKEVLLYHVHPGDICVLTTACLLGGEHFPAEAQAETDLRVQVMTKRQFDELIASSATFRQQVFDGFGERINELIKTIQKLALESIEQRLAKYLLVQGQNDIALTHQKIAGEIGTVREVVSRHLKRFEQAKLVTRQRGKITLIDRDALLALI